jgi:putative ABC transport system permease protein
VVSADYFKAMRIPLVSGRSFQPTDSRLSVPLIRWFPQQPLPPRFDEPQAAPVAVVNEAMARQFWPGETPLGKRFAILSSPAITIIGVVGDVRHTGLGDRPNPEFYLSDLQEPRGDMAVVVRTAGDPIALAPGMRAQLKALDAALPVQRLMTMDDVLLRATGRPRFSALVLGSFGALALMMAVVGTYGVVSYSVAQRTHEIGIRAALGASASDVMRLVLGRALALTLAGIALGAAGAAALTRVLAGLLYDVRPTDGPTYLTMALATGVVAMLASYIPTRRAMRVDPVEALRRP